MSNFINKLMEDANRVNREDVENLLEAVQGSAILGTLNDEEITSYTILANMELELSHLQDHYAKRYLGRTVDRLVDPDRLLSMSIQQMVEVGGSSISFFDNVTEAEDFFMRISNWEMQTAVFWNRVRSRINVFSKSLEVRHGWRVVDAGSKYR